MNRFASASWRHPTRRSNGVRWSGMTEWRPVKLSKRLPNLQARARLRATMRQWFAAEGFVEVGTPILPAAARAQVHLPRFVTVCELPDGQERERSLHRLHVVAL